MSRVEGNLVVLFSGGGFRSNTNIQQSNSATVHTGPKKAGVGFPPLEPFAHFFNHNTHQHTGAKTNDSLQTFFIS